MASTQRRLTDDEKSELANLNAAVTSAIAARRQWLDAKMHETSRLKVGNDIYDVDSGRKLGTVSRLYRFWEDRDDGIRDTSIECSYEYETMPRCFDNTSRQTGVRLGTQEDVLEHAEFRVSMLRAAAGLGKL